MRGTKSYGPSAIFGQNHLRAVTVGIYLRALKMPEENQLCNLGGNGEPGVIHYTALSHRVSAGCREVVGDGDEGAV